jgi:hypothetical protein
MARGDGVRSAAVVLLALALVLVSGCQQGHRPDTAAVPSGPSSGAVGVEYTFSSSAEDHDGDDVAIRFDWGDGDTSEWSPWVRPGDTVTMSHAWAASGPFGVKAQAKARNFTISGWSDGCTFAAQCTFVKTLGGTGDDLGESVEQTRDGGYIITGYTWSFGAGYCDVWLVKTDAAGNTVWTKTFGGKADDRGYSVQQTQDGGYIIAGLTKSDWTSCVDAWLIRTDATGDTLWTRTYGGAKNDYSLSVQQTQDGGFILAGGTGSRGAGGYDVWLFKTDADGNKVWDKTLGGEGREGASQVQQTRDGGYIITGYTTSYGAGGSDVWLIKTDADGDTLWTRTFGAGSDDEGSSVQQTQDGGYVIAGYTTSYGAGYEQAWLIKTDANGDTVWTRAFGGSNAERSSCVRQTQDGGYIVAGYTWSYGAGKDDVWLVKTDANGAMAWTRTFGGPSWDEGNSVQQTQDGGYIIAGTTWSSGAGRGDICLIKTDAAGNVDDGGGEVRSPKSE